MLLPGLENMKMDYLENDRARYRLPGAKGGHQSRRGVLALALKLSP